MFDIKQGFLKCPGDYETSSPVPKRYKTLRNLFLVLFIISLFLSMRLKENIFADIICVLNFVICSFFYYKYIQCNEEFVKKHGKYFLLTAGSIVIATLSVVIAVFEYFWRSNVNISVVLIASAIVFGVLSFWFNRKNREM